MKKDICSDLKVIPQFEGTCWFNAFLMSVLYSQNARKIMIKVSKTWNKKDKFLNNLKYILKKNYNDPSIINYYNKIQPQILLFEYLKKYDINLENKLKEKNKQELLRDKFGLSYIYFATFLKNLDNKTLDIYYDSNTNTNIINFNKNIKMDIDEKGRFTTNYKYQKTDIKKERNVINKIIKDIPNFIVLYHSELMNYNHISNAYNFINLLNKDEANVYNLSSYKIKIDGIKEYKDIIIFNGIKYKLDSCIINNFNNIGSHVINGITCNNNKYVYNGWTTNNEQNNIKSSCSLMKYDWDLRKNQEFCLNSKNCNLEFIINKDDLCFSFNKGNRLLIYVRIFEDIKTTNITTINSSKINLSNIKSIIKDIYQIDNLNEEEIKNHLLYFIKIEFEIKNKKDLDIYLATYLKKKTIDEIKELLFYKISFDNDIPRKKKMYKLDKLKTLTEEKIINSLNFYTINEFNQNKIKELNIFIKNYFIGKSIKDLKKMLLDKLIATFNISEKKKIIKKVINNCPIIRRPINNKCVNKDYPFIKKNVKGFECCYKKQ
jgi:hypothetical protein